MQKPISKALLQELDFLMQNPECTAAQALQEIMTDCEILGMSRALCRECQDIGIELGVYKPISKEQLAQTVCIGCAAYDFKRDGVHYVFDSWEPISRLSIEEIIR
jgi:hypothetical protein